MLRDAILRAAARTEAVEHRGDRGHGMHYVFRLPLRTSKGEALVLTAWIVRRGEDFPRLTTCYMV